MLTPRAFLPLLTDVTCFAEHASGLRLRRYQVDVARAVAHSVANGLGLSLVVMFPRQSGKNELQAQIEAYLLTVLSGLDVEIVKVSPTWKPQSLNAMRRLERVLEKNRLVGQIPGGWRRENGYIFRVGRARIFFLSGSPEAHIVGATASLLLEVDEAQDVQIAKFDRDIAPMASSTNATRIFWGTAWSDTTLLARELRAARAAEARDGLRRAFVLTAEDVAREVPAYGRFVADQVARLGREHPMVRTQYYSEEIGAEGGMFPAARAALMRGEHTPQDAPEPGAIYAFLLDVAGEERGGAEGQPSNRRDATALTIVAVGLDGLDDPGLRAPIYRVAARHLWVGEAQTALYGRITALAALWNPQRLVVDATGVGAGLASFLERALPGRVLPFVFTAASKSRLGWDFLGICDTGRFREYRAERSEPECPLSALFWRQAAGCQYEVHPGPGRLLSWSVPESARDPLGDGLLHDDLLVSTALCALLDGQTWYHTGCTLIIPRPDPLEEMDEY